jgi:Abortive infection alpha
MANELIRPIDADTAHAIEELSKTAGKGLDVVTGAGGYAVDVLGRTPHNLIAFLFGDRLVHWRVRQLAVLQQRTREILSQRGVHEQEENPSIEIPLLEAAIDEGREELVTAWAKLWAAAMDPSRKKAVRRELIDTVKNMEPIDAVLFDACVQSLALQSSSGKRLAEVVVEMGLPYGTDDLLVSIEALKSLNLVGTLELDQGVITPYGRILARAIAE